MIFYFTFKTLQLFLKVTKCIVSSAVYTNIEKNIDYQVHNYNTFSTATLLHYSLVNICIPLPAWCEARATCRDFHPAKLPLRQRLLFCLVFLKPIQLNMLPKATISNTTMTNPKTQKEFYCI